MRPRRQEQARTSDVDSQADASEQKEADTEQTLKELHRIIASQERIEERFSALHAEVTAEVQQVRAQVTSEVQLVRALKSQRKCSMCALKYKYGVQSWKRRWAQSS